MLNIRHFFQACLYCQSYFEIETGEVLCRHCQAEWRKKKINTHMHEQFISRSLIEWSLDKPSAGDLIKRLKASDNVRGGQRFRFMAMKYWTQFYAHEKFSAKDIVFVPAPARAEMEDDHASLFANELSKLFGAPTMKLLRRVSQNEQKGLNREERAQNRLVLRDENQPDLSRVLRRKIVFIDDLIASGQTARAAYFALDKPREFEAWAIAFRPLFFAPSLAKQSGS